MLACRILFQKLKSWYARGGKEDNYSKYRFTGKESKLFSGNFMHLVLHIFYSCPNLSHLEKIKPLVFHYIRIQLREISSLKARIHVGPTYVEELKRKCKKYFNGNALFLQKVTPTIWNIGYAVPYHAKKIFDEFG